MAASLCTESRRHRQRGSALLDALIAIVLLGFIGTGLLYATSRAAMAQRSANAMNLTVAELRSRVQLDGMAKGCAGGEDDDAGLTLEIAPGVRPGEVTRTCRVQSAKVTVNGMSKEVQVPHVVIEVTDKALLGSRDALVVRNW